MKHLCFLVASGVLTLGSSAIVTMAMDHTPYNLETFEKGMLKRAIASHLTYHEDDWRHVYQESKGRLYGLSEDIARAKFQEKSQDLEKIYYNIFYDPSNPDPEKAKIIAGLQAKLMLRNYYNQQCQNIIVAYPKKYSAYSYTIPEAHLILIIESLAYKLQEDMLKQVRWIQKEGSITVDQLLARAIEANPLMDEYHKTFDLQLREIQKIGPDDYIKRLEKAAEEHSKAQELVHQEQLRRAQERLKNIPIPPPPPAKDYKVIPYKERRAMLMNNLAQEIKEHNLSPPSENTLPLTAVKKKFTPPPGAGKLPDNVLSEITSFQLRKTLKPASDRVLKEMVSDQASVEYFEFFNKLQKRRDVIKESEEDDNDQSLNSWDSSSED